MTKISKEFLFNRYARNLTDVKNALHPRLRIEPDADDIFICPLCFDKYFTREALEWDDVLTLEHVPPKSVGGHVQTLTCQACNNKSGGSKLDSQLALKLSYEDIVSGRSEEPLNAIATLNDQIRLPVEVYREDNGNLFITPPAKIRSKSKPQVDAFTESFMSGPKKIDFQFKLFSSTRANWAILRSAYLWAFSLFGYGFLINANLQAIRGQINYPTEQVLPTPGIIREDFPNEMLGTNIISSPEEARSYLVVFDIFSRNKTKTRYGVFLPSPNRPGLSLYMWLNEHQGTSVTYQIEHIVNDLDFLENPLACFDLWNELGKT